MNWLHEIPEQHKKSLSRVLEFVYDFPGLIGVVGSSANEKYPLGNDIDIALVGLSKLDALQYSYELANKLYLTYLNDLRRLSDGETLEDLEYPLIKEIRFDLEDPMVSTSQEMVSGHGGSNISLEILPYSIGDKRLEGGHHTEYRSKKIGPNRSLIDIVVDYSFQNRTIEKNILDWKKVMDMSDRKYFVLKEYIVTNFFSI